MDNLTDEANKVTEDRIMKTPFLQQANDDRLVWKV